MPEVSAHFGRFRVTEIALSEGALRQFEDAPILAAAELLAHARVDAIAWNGTSSGWLGFEADERLCRRLTEATGILATTSMLALNQVLASIGVRRLGLVTPYTDDVQARLVANYEALGYACVGERHLGLHDNFSFCEVQGEPLRDMARAVVAEGAQAVVIVCTNLRAAPLVEALESELGVPVLDSIAAAVWGSLWLALAS